MWSNYWTIIEKYFENGNKVNSRSPDKGADGIGKIRNQLIPVN